MRKAMLGLMVVGVALAVTPAAQAAETVVCGQNVDHSIVVDNDLTNCPTVGLETGANGITIDLNGHTIDGQPGIAGIVVDNNDVTIKNGRITGFLSGVSVHDANRATIKTLKIDTTTGFAISIDETAPGALVKGNLVRAWGTGTGILVQGQGPRVISNGIGTGGNGGTGPALHVDSASGVEVRDNTISGSGGNGIRMTFADSNIISGNRVCGNENGVEVTTDSDSNVLADNLFCSNTQRGVVVSDATSKGNRLEANLITGNGQDGLRVTDAVNTAVVGNRAQSNESSGIAIEAAASTSKLKNNVANYNGSFGFQVMGSVVDLGGNKAKGNFLENCTGAISC